MDPRKFDEMIKRVSQSLSRRSIVGGTVGASLLTAAGLSEDVLSAKNKKNRNNGNKKNRAANKKDDKGKDNKGGGGKDNDKGGGGKDNDKNKKDNGGGGGDARSEACIQTGKKCPAKKPRGKKKKKLGCDDCCQGITVEVTNRKGKKVTKCSCRPLDAVCTNENSSQCCSGVCGDGRCQFAPCTDIGGACANDFDCCSNFCSGGVCQTLS